MKKFLTLMSCVAALLTVGCTNDIDEGLVIPSSSDTPAINIDGSIRQTYTTRVDDGGFCGGDQVGLYGVNYTDDNSTQGTLLSSGNQVDNAKYTLNEYGKWVATNGVYYKDAVTNIDLYAYYPYGNPENVNAYAVELYADQSGKSLIDGYSLSDFLWGKVENVTPSEEAVKIKYTHRMSALKLSLVAGDGWADESAFAEAVDGVIVINTTRQAEIDLSTGVVTAMGTPSSEGTIMRSTAEGYRAIIVPQNMAASTALFAITVDGVTYRYKIPESIYFESGKMTSFTVQINRKEFNGDVEFELLGCEIVDWIADLESHGGEARQYYVVHCEEPGTLKAKILADSKNPAKIKNLKVSGKISTNDFYFMRDEMEILQSINLKETQIVGPKWRWYGVINGGTYDYEYFHTDYPSNLDEATAQVQARHPGATIYTSSYSQVELPDHEIPEKAFAQKSSLVNFVFPEKVTKIGSDAFDRTMLSGTLIIPDDVVEICDGAFAQTLISTANLPAGLKILGVRAFAYNHNLTSCPLPLGLEKIGSSCFSECPLTGTLTLPSGLTEIPGHCFKGCRFVGDLIIPDGVKKIGDTAFFHDPADYTYRGWGGTLHLPDSVEEIGYSAFFNCGFQGSLVIPKNITIIEETTFAMNDFTSIILPEGLISIESASTNVGYAGAFEENWRLCEPVVFPESLISIGKKAFNGCGQIPSVHFGSNLTTIGQEAFGGCFYLSSIVCDAITPPAVLSSAFSGVAKDNFTVEVPEKSIVKYQTASGWSDFKRIGAHYDFSLSRRLFRALNAQESRTYVLRAPSGQNWSVESCPEWVTVEPASGVGKVEVTITVDEMTDSEVGSFELNVGTYYSPSYETHEGRAGEIVFLLNDKEYRTTMTVEQYDYEYGDGDVIVNQTATKGGGVNLVFMGDCFDAQDIAEGTYLNGVNEAIEYYFGIEPYKTYRDYFNVYTVLGLSPDSGVGTVSTIKDAKFGSQYSLGGVTPDTKVTFEYAMKAATVTEDNLNQTLVVMIENTTDYGGICYMWGDGSAIAICPMSRDAYPYDFRGIVQHEAGGHGFAKLGDEYIYTLGFISACGCDHPHLPTFYSGKANGWFRNLSDSGNMDIVPWSHLIFNEKYSNIVDIYEGGYFHSRGIYRSEATSCMNNNIPYFSAISRQEMVERIMRYAGLEFSLEEFYDNDVLDASNNTRALDPVPDNIVTSSGAAKQMPPVFMGDKPEL